MPDLGDLVAIETREKERLAIVTPLRVLFTGRRQEELLAAVQKLAAEGTRRFVIDLSDIRYLDSSSLGTIVACHSAAKGAGGQLGLVAVDGRLRGLLSAAMLLQVIPLFGTVSEAASGLAV